MIGELFSKIWRAFTSVTETAFEAPRISLTLIMCRPTPDCSGPTISPFCALASCLAKIVGNSSIDAHPILPPLSACGSAE